MSHTKGSDLVATDSEAKKVAVKSAPKAPTENQKKEG